MDIITGFVLSDGDCTLLVLEGLRARAIARMLQELNCRTLPPANEQTAQCIGVSSGSVRVRVASGSSVRIGSDQ